VIGSMIRKSRSGECKIVHDFSGSLRVQVEYYVIDLVTGYGERVSEAESRYHEPI
jgi:hypothetical protein